MLPPSSILSIISAVGSLLVIIACMFMRRRYFIHIIMMMGLTDLAFSIVAALGFPSDSSPECAVQAAFEIFFLRANWFWTCMLIYQMYRFFLHDHVWPAFKIHTIVWSLSALLTFLPLINGRFGRSGDNSELCFLVSNSSIWYLSWFIIDWFLCIYISAALMIYFISKLIAKSRSTTDAKLVEGIITLLKALFLYPVVLMLTWGINITVNLVVIASNNGSVDSNPSPSVFRLLRGVTDIAVLNGTLLAMVFFYKSPEARYNFAKLLGCSRFVNDLDSSVPLDYAQSFEPDLGEFAITTSLFSRSVSSYSFSRATDIPQPSSNSGNSGERGPQPSIYAPFLPSFGRKTVTSSPRTRGKGERTPSWSDSTPTGNAIRPGSRSPLSESIRQSNVELRPSEPHISTLPLPGIPSLSIRESDDFQGSLST